VSQQLAHVLTRKLLCACGVCGQVRCAKRFPHSPTKSADTTLRIVAYPQEPPFWAFCHEEGHNLSRAARLSPKSTNESRMIHGDKLHSGLQHHSFRGILTNGTLAMHLICCVVITTSFNSIKSPDSCVVVGGSIGNSKETPLTKNSHRPIVPLSTLGNITCITGMNDNQTE